MKKLKTWQIVCLVIIWPAGLWYSYRWFKNRNVSVADDNNTNYDYDVVFVNKGSKIYHCDQLCAMSQSAVCEEIKEKQAIKQGLRKCRKCYGCEK